MDDNSSTRTGDAQDCGTNRTRRQALKAAGIAAAACVVPATSASAATSVAASSLPKPQDVPRIQRGRTYKAKTDPDLSLVHSSTLSWHGIQDSDDAKEHVFTLETCGRTHLNNGVEVAPEATHFWLETNKDDREEYGNDYTIVPYPNTQYQQLFPGDSSSSGGFIPDMIEVSFDYLVGLTNPAVGAALVADDLKEAMEPHDNISEYWKPSYGWKGSNPSNRAVGTAGGHIQRFHVKVPDDAAANDNLGTDIFSETTHWKPSGSSLYELNNHWFESVFGLSFPDVSSVPIISQSYNKYGWIPPEVSNTVWER